MPRGETMPSSVRFYSSVVAKLQRESAAREGAWTRARDEEKIQKEGSPTGRGGAAKKTPSCVKPGAAAARSS